MKRFVLFSIIAVPGFLGAQAPAGTGVILGVSIRGDRPEPLGYTVVSIPSQGGQVLSNERGAFLLTNLRPGSIDLRLKHIGFAARDTSVIVAGNDTLRLRVALTPLAIDLPAIRVSAPCGDKRADPTSRAALAELFGQVTQNAERYRLLADSNPFVMRMYRIIGFRELDGSLHADAIDTILRHPYPKNTYRPGHLLNDGEENGHPMTYLTVPELADFADTAFTNNHCFSYGGVDTLNGDTVIRVRFEPAPAIRNEVDFKGTMYLRARDYELVRSELMLSRLSRDLGLMGVRAYVVTTTFREIVPGIPILWHVESRSEIYMAAPQFEMDQVLDVQWVNRPP